ncbi:MAG: hypothetical protein A2283_05985 [Lentisphaerae bacterium RIFOXYA12_FULL_48_11]|nr:MAG: hypothetical protein A2283_05985 [Lentisphaerae bacterium RIFOXYA12_FULL_48_11]
MILSEVKKLLAAAMNRPDIDSIPDGLCMGDWPEWDSMAHVALLVGIQERYGFMPAPEEIPETISLPRLVTFLEGKLGGYSKSKADISSQDGWNTVFDNLFGGDDMPPDICIYIHSRTAPLIGAGFGGLDRLIDLLRGKDGTRTLVFPAFPFSSRSYKGYIASRPPFKVKSTSAFTGLLPELVRAGSRDLYRSAHPLLSEMAVGPKAKWIVSEAHTASDPFHPLSTYRRLMEDDAIMVGLGLDMNTNAIIHYVDDHFKDRYPFPVYLPEPLDFDIEFEDGHVETRSYLAYSPDMVRRIKPRNLRPYFSATPEIVREISCNGVSFFRLRIKPFLEKCTALAESALNIGELPPWFVNVP